MCRENSPWRDPGSGRWALVMTGMLGGLGVRLQPGEGAGNGLWDWWRSGDPGSRGLVAVLIGNVLDVHMLALGGDPGKATMDVAMDISASGLIDSVGGLQVGVESVGADIFRAVQDLGVDIVVRAGHWGNGGGHSHNGEDHHLDRNRQD